MTINISRMARKYKARELGVKITREFEEIEKDSVNTEDFLDNIRPLLSNFFEASSCFLIIEDGEDFLISTKHNGDYDEELFIELASNSAKGNEPLIIKNTKKHERLKEHNISSLIAIPLDAGEYQGSVIFGYQTKQSFSRFDYWKIAVVQEKLIDSLNKIRIKDELNSKNEELKIIEMIDYFRSNSGDNIKLITGVLKEIKKETSCGTAFFYLKKKDDRLLLADKPVTSAFIKENRTVLINLADKALEDFEMKEFGESNNDIVNALCIPFAVSEESQGVFGIVNAEFDRRNRKIIQVAAKQVSYIVSEDWEKSQIKNVFSKYVSSEIMESMLKNEEQDYLKTKRGEVTVLFSDIRGFTGLSERLPPEKIIKMLNEYFDMMTKIVLKNKGTIDKFIGDAIMAVWGAPLYEVSHAYRATKAALEMQKAQKELSKKYALEGIPFEIGIGICTGEAVIGNIGSNMKMDYTVIGDVVNTASRLCSAANPGQVLVSKNTYLETGKNIKVIELEPLKMKNKQQQVPVYTALSIKENGYGSPDHYQIKQHIRNEIIAASAGD